MIEVKNIDVFYGNIQALKSVSISVAHGEIVDASYGCGLSFRDPDNIALELFAPPA